jgi:hypothetical protein
MVIHIRISYNIHTLIMTILLDFYGISMIFSDTRSMRNIDELAMSENTNVPMKPPDRPLTGHVSRREFLKLSAIMAGSTLLLVNGCGYLEQFDPHIDLAMPAVPPDFKRFVLTRIEQTLEQPTITEVALGSQHQNMQVSLLAHDRAEVQIFDDIKDVLDSYMSEGQMELHWLDRS